jgi:hypothetical protein
VRGLDEGQRITLDSDDPEFPLKALELKARRRNRDRLAGGLSEAVLLERDVRLADQEKRVHGLPPVSGRTAGEGGAVVSGRCVAPFEMSATPTVNGCTLLNTVVGAIGLRLTSEKAGTGNTRGCAFSLRGGDSARSGMKLIGACGSVIGDVPSVVFS